MTNNVNVDWSLAVPMPEQRVEAVDLALLVQEHASLLFRVAHSVLRNATEAEDTVQDAFVRVLERRRQLPEVRQMRVAGAHYLESGAGPAPAHPPRPDGHALCRRPGEPGVFRRACAGEAEEVCRVLRAVDALPKLERQVLLLATVQELGTAELALVCGKSESAVRALLFRARTRLRERLEAASAPKKGGV